MPKEETAEQQLASFMAKFTPEIAFLARAIRGEMRHLYPSALELVYDNYNALAIGYSPTERTSEAIFSIALSAPDKQFDYTLSLASIALARKVNGARDSLRMRGL